MRERPGRHLEAKKGLSWHFTSKELDEETGLYYYGARYYEPTTSRWMSPDPAGFELINPMDEDGEPLADGWPEGFGPGQSGGMREGYSVIEALNWYAYVSNNPVKYTDPTGMEGTSDEPDTIQWTALYLEITGTVGVGTLNEEDPVFGMGIASVRFENEEGEAFMADYTFMLSSEDTTVGALTASLTGSVGVLQADFPAETSQEKIAESYEGIFLNRGISVSVASVQHVIDTEGLWQGGEVGASAGKGITVGKIGFKYTLRRMRPVAKTP